MSISKNEFIQLLNDANKTTEFVLDLSSLKSTAIDHVTLDYLPGPTLRLSPLTSFQASGDGNSVTVKGTGATGFFNRMTLELQFDYVNSGPVNLGISATAPEGWTFYANFPLLRGTVLQLLTFAVGQPPHFQWHSDNTNGLAFSGVVDVKSMSGGLSELLGVDNQTFTGIIKLCQHGNAVAQIEIDSPPISQMDLKIFKVNNTRIKVGSYSTYNFITKETHAIPYFIFSTEIPFTAQNRPHTLPLSATIYDFGSAIRFEADLTGVAGAALDEISALAKDFNIDIAALIPSSFHLEEYVRFDHFFFDIDFSNPHKLSMIGFDIGSARAWPLFHLSASDKSIDLTNVWFHYRLNDPLGAKLGWIGGGGELVLGDKGTIVASASYPNFTVLGGLKEDSVLKFSELLADLFGPAKNIPEINVNALAFEFSKNTYAFKTEIEGLLPIGNLPLAIEDIRLEFSHSPTQLTAFLGGIFEVVGITVLVSANYQGYENGWQFEGSTGTGQQIPIGKMMEYLANTFGITQEFPKTLDGLSINNIKVSFNSKTNDATYTCAFQFPVVNQNLNLIVDIGLFHVDGKFQKTFKGQLLMAGLQFDLDFQTGAGASIFWGDYQNPGGKTFTVADILKLLSTDTQLLDATKGLKFNIKDAFVGYYKGEAKGAAAKWLLGLDMDFGADLSGLPLVGKYIPKEEALRLTFQPRIATQELTATEITALKGLIAGQNITLPATLPKGVTLDIQLNLGSATVPMSLPIGLQNGQLANNSPAPAPGAAAAPAEKVSWYNLQKSFGPLQLQRVGIQFEKGLLSFLLDGGFSVGGLTLSLMGLTANTKLNPIALSFDLKGLGVDFKKDPIEIGGAFLKETLTDENNQPYTAYDGMAIIRAKQFALSAIGSYADYQGHPSMFIYAVLDAPLGGPPFFFVKGLAAGFGFNRALKAPSIDQVQQFPLVAQAIAGTPNTVTDIGTQIRSLHTYMPPATGEYFLAAGIRFTSFEMIDSFALLIVSFGKQFEVDLLGLSTLVLPTPAAGNAVTPLAEVQMALKASFIPEIGFLGVEAKLTPASYLFSRDCHLTGGFAFYSWFSGDHNGDFALTLGGYHPSYQRPAHFPNVDRLGFNWVVTSNLSIKGDAYFALVPSAVMAGGHLNALWVDGNLSAWFTAGADFLLAWKPYHYDARLYVDVGVSYTYHFFGTHHITADVGADLHIWGPDFSGTARVHLWIITFTVSFGAGASATPPPLGWAEVKAAFLPANPAEICSISVKDGLEKKTGQGATAKFVVNPKDFTVGINSLIPLKSAQRQVSDNPAENKAIALAGANTGWGVGPMAMNSGDTDSRLVLRIKKGSSYVTEQFTVTPVFKSVPVALWGQSASPSLNGGRLIEQAVCGFDITGLPPKTPKQLPQFIDRKNFQFSLDTIPDGWKWSDIPASELASGAAINAPEKESTRRNTVRDHIETVQAQRTQLLKDLGFATPVFPDKSIADAFIVAPRFTQAPA